MATQYHVNPRFRAYGKARLEIARRASTRAEWNELWKPPQNDFPFTWGRHWKHCVEYRVDDYAAEAGFYIDVLGFPVNAFDPQYAQFTGPDGEFFIAFLPAGPDQPATPPDALRLQFMVSDVLVTTTELERRGVVFDQEPQPLSPGSNLLVASFRTPHGIQVDLWGEAQPAVSKVTAAPVWQAHKPVAEENSSPQPRPSYQPARQPLKRSAEIKPEMQQSQPIADPAQDIAKRPEPRKPPEIPQVDHFFPIHAPGKATPPKPKLRIRLANPRPLLARDQA